MRLTAPGNRTPLNKEGETRLIFKNYEQFNGK